MQSFENLLYPSDNKFISNRHQFLKIEEIQCWYKNIGIICNISHSLNWDGNGNVFLEDNEENLIRLKVDNFEHWRILSLFLQKKKGSGALLAVIWCMFQMKWFLVLTDINIDSANHIWELCKMTLNKEVKSPAEMKYFTSDVSRIQPQLR